MSNTGRRTSSRTSSGRRGNYNNSRYRDGSSYRRSSYMNQRTRQRRNQLMIRKIIAIVVIIIIVIVAVFMFRGCKRDSIGDITLKAGDSAIYIQSDGSVSYAVSEKFDKEYYNKKELEEMIESEIINFNSGPHSSSVECTDLESFSVSDGAAMVIINFDTIEDYVSYEKECNGVSDNEIFIGSVKTAVESEYDISGQFKKVKDNTVTDEEVAAETIQSYDGKIIILREQMKVQLEDGNINYVSSNCTMKDGIVTVTDEEMAYIVYK